MSLLMCLSCLFLQSVESCKKRHSGQWCSIVVLLSVVRRRLTGGGTPSLMFLLAGSKANEIDVSRMLSGGSTRENVERKTSVLPLRSED